MIVRKTNQALKRLAIVRPDLFATYTNITLVAGTVQSCPTDSMRLIDVTGASNGFQVKEINQDALDAMYPPWTTVTPAIPTNWMRYVRDPNRFQVYPPSIPGDILQILYAKTPQNYILGDTVVLGDAYEPLVIDCVIWLLESVDAEHVESGRAKMFLDSFTTGYTSGLQARKITDTSAAGEDPKDVL
jgi:hypothetical protein